MKKLLMMSALAATMTAYAHEPADTTWIENAEKVVIVTSDTTQQIQIIGQKGDSNFRLEKKVPINTCKMHKDGCDKYRAWKPYFDFGVGVNTPLNVSDGYGFATFRSWEIYVGFRWGYTPEKGLQTYSIGLWADWKNYGLSTDKMLVKDGDGVTFLTDYPAGATHRHSRIKIFSLAVPLLFHQKLGRNSKCSFAIGPVVNFNLRGRLNSEYDMGDAEQQMSIKDIGYRPVTIDLMAMFNYKTLGIYCKFSPMTVFKKDKGPQFKSLTFGLCL